MANLSDVSMADAPELGEGFMPIPPGEYAIYMESSERKTTKAGTGEYLECVFVVASGEYENRKVYWRSNLWNQNQQTVEIAKSQLRAICEVTLGQPMPINNDSGSLHNKLFMALIDNVARNDQPDKRTNEIVFRKGTIRSMKDAEKKPVVIPSANANPEPQPQAAKSAVGGGKPPWKKQ